MKAAVITILDNPRSVAAAERCIESGREFGVEVVKIRAVTPADEPAMLAARHDVAVAGFNNNKYSRLLPCIATFMSHYGCWVVCAFCLEPLQILEHDAVFVGDVPDLSSVTHGCNLAKPSFGLFETPEPGIGPFVSKAGGYLGGAHGYYVTPDGAIDLLDHVHEAEPTDVYINRKRFPWLQEAYPWCIEAHDEFTTIQTEEGCKAKHNKVEII